MSPVSTKIKNMQTLPPLKIQQRQLPESLQKAAGLMRAKRKALEQHLQTVRKEWSRSSK